MRILFLYLFFVSTAFAQKTDATSSGEPSRVSIFTRTSYLGGVTNGVDPVARFGVGLNFTYEIMLTRVSFVYESDGYAGFSSEIIARIWQAHMGSRFYLGVYPGVELGVIMKKDNAKTLMSWGCMLRYSKIFWDRLEVAIEIPINIRIRDVETGGVVYPEYRVRFIVGYYMGQRKRGR
jgi:hypothetical protein